MRLSRLPCLAAALTLAAPLAAPAQATAGLFCEPSGKGGGPSLSLVITRGLPGGIFGATLAEDGREPRSTMGENPPIVLAQAWIDEKRIMVDIADKDLMEYVARLRARPAGEGGAAGTLDYGGRKYSVRCEES